MTGLGGLVGRDLLAGRRIFLGLLAVTIAVGFIAGSAAALVGGTTAMDLPVVATSGRGDATQSSFVGFIVGTAVLFSLVPTIVVVSSTARLAIRLRRRVYARWLLVGVSASSVRAIILTQFVTIAVIGGILGVGAASLFAPPLLTRALAGMDISVDGTHGTIGFAPAPTLLGSAIALAAVVLVVLASAPRAISDAARTSPIEAIRDADAPVHRRRWTRFVALGLVGLLALQCIQAMTIGDDMGLANGAVSLPVMLAAMVATAGSWLSLRVLRGWTSFIPAGRSTSWYLARHEAAAQLERSSAAVNPLMIGMALAGGAYGVVATMAAASGSQAAGGLFGFVVTIAGGPLLIASVGAAANVYMSGNDRERQIGLLRASGATPRVVLRGAVFEALALTGTATLLAVVVDLIALAILSAALGFTPLVLPPGPVLVMAGCGALLMVAATLVPTLAALGRPTTRSLVVD